MSFEWKKYSIGEISEVFDGPHATPKKTESGHIFLGISNLVGGRIDLSSTEYLSEYDYKIWTRRVTPKENDLVFSYETRLGEVAIIPKNFTCCLGRRMGLLRLDQKIVDPKFLLYYYLSPNFQDVIKEKTIHGSTVDRISIKEFPDFPIFLPPLHTQYHIASILTALDDKIELNRRMNETLEGIAQAVWGEWFGKYASGEELHEGWRWGNVLELAKLIGGGTPKTEVAEYWGGDIPWISGKDITPNNRSIIIETEKMITQAGLHSSSTKLLPAFSTVVSARGTVGNFCMIPSEMTISQSNYALKSIVESTDFFLFQQVANLISEMQQKSYGTVFDTITTKTFSEIEIPIPPFYKMVEYNKAIGPIFEKRIANLQQSRILTTLRDTLLPRLMSGSIVY